MEGSRADDVHSGAISIQMEVNDVGVRESHRAVGMDRTLGHSSSCRLGK